MNIGRVRRAGRCRTHASHAASTRSFTGTPRPAAHRRRVQGEPQAADPRYGGKSPIVFADADVDRRRRRVQAVLQSGQCASPARMFVRRVHEGWWDGWSRPTIRLGSGSTHRSMGPVSAAQLRRVSAFVEEARADGATVLTHRRSTTRPARTLRGPDRAQWRSPSSPSYRQVFLVLRSPASPTRTSRTARQRRALRSRCRRLTPTCAAPTGSRHWLRGRWVNTMDSTSPHRTVGTR